ncbi:SBBP repeat-containing protein [Paraflavisolibacter sp. H34]|uniref:SBBP repeat-containing protein n=1 Tax=Huijunlia imazamoxiresistens TaxID=3127457 RepID=UPI00301870F7
MKTPLCAGRFFLFSLLLLWPALSPAQLSEKWLNQFSSTASLSSDKAEALALDGSGNAYITGESNGDFLTLKYNPDGSRKWAVTYNGTGSSADGATAIGVDGSGNVYVTGWSTGSGSGTDIVTIKYGTDGSTKWVARHNGPLGGEDRPYALGVDGSGNVVVTGKVAFAPDNDNFITIKYNKDGVRLWYALYNSLGKETSRKTAKALALDASGNIYITGSGFNSSGQETYTTIKYNANGLQQWVATGPAHSAANDLAVDGSGNVYVTGGIYDGVADFYTVKYSPAGAPIWSKAFNSGFVDGRNNIDQAYALALDGSGNVIVAGGSEYDGDQKDYATVKYSPAGVQLWSAKYDGPGGGNDYPFDLATDGSGNIYVTGQSDGGDTGLDFATLKYDKNGVQKWLRRFNGTGNGFDGARALKLDKSGNLYVAGRSVGAGTSDDYLLLKYGTDGSTKWTKRYAPSSAKMAEGPITRTTNKKFTVPTRKLNY